jgi:hypothetical protein
MNQSIDAVLVARKLNGSDMLQNRSLAAEMQKHPRAREAAIFIQGVSLVKGGVEGFAKRLIDHQISSIGTETMLRLGALAAYDPRQFFSIWREIPLYIRKDLHGEAWRIELLNEDMPGWCDDAHRVQQMQEEIAAKNRFFPHDGYARQESEWRAARIADRYSENPFEKVCASDEVLAAALTRLTPAALQNLCIKHAKKELVADLRKLAEDPSSLITVGPWYWWDLFPALLREMDRWAEEIAGIIARTRVYEAVEDGSAFAFETGKPIQVDGQTRFGKSIAEETWCLAHPGRGRYVSVPCSNRHDDLLSKIAKAFGISSTGRQMREEVTLVCQVFKVVIVLDEAHELFPTKFSKNTVPQRLNWIRLELFKHDVPVALVTTPQVWSTARQRFKETTGWVDEQFMGCIVKYPQIPDEITSEEMIAIGRLQMPYLSLSYIKLIAGRAKQCAQYLAYFEAVALNAAWIAKRAGRTEITIEDISKAMIEATPSEVRRAAEKEAQRKGAASSSLSSDPAAKRNSRKKSKSTQTRALPAIPEERAISPLPRAGARQITPTLVTA